MIISAMEQAYTDNPKIGRYILMRQTGCSSGKAQRFLAKKRKAEPSAEKPSLSELLTMSGHLRKEEIALLVKSAKLPQRETEKRSFAWGNNSFKFALIADTHNGHIKSSGEWWAKACHRIEQEKCSIAFHAGDISEGMSGRDGHVYELDAIGSTAQLDLTEARFKMCPVPIHGITGNHDLWAYKTTGLDFGVELAKRMPEQFHYLGQNEAVVTIDGVKIMLSHPGDGSSYATSYASQKFVEALTGGEKPHILLMGHHHKSIFHVCRNVMVFEAGTLCGQTGWMRGKKLAAHVGFWIIEVWPSQDGGVERIKSEWVPFFKEGER